MTHTKGPWKAEGETVIAIDGNLEMQIASGIAGEANALLIAAAPELLEACERMFRSLGAYLDFSSLTQSTCYAPKESLELGRAAIAKATGESK